jgi:hypothetical protein
VTGRKVILGAAVVAALAAPAVAEARMIDLRLSGQGGGMFGWTTTPNAQDMFRTAAGPGVGVEAGLKLLVFDASVSVLQMFKDGLGGTFIQGLLGVDVDLPAGNTKLDTGQNVHIIHTGAVFGFVLGTSAPAMTPVMSDQLADRGFVGRGRLAYEYYLNPFMGVGVEGHFGWHYLVGGANATISDHSQGYHIAALGSFTFHLGY